MALPNSDSVADIQAALTVDATPAGPPRLEIINSYTYTIETGRTPVI